MRQNRIFSITIVCLFISLAISACSAVQTEDADAQIQESSVEAGLSVAVADEEAEDTSERSEQPATTEINEETGTRDEPLLQSGSSNETLLGKNPEGEAKTEEEEPAEDLEIEAEDLEIEYEELPAPQKDEIVRVLDYIPDILVDLRYAADNNFTGTVIYNFTDAFLRYGTIEKLAKAQEQAQKDGYSLKIWDAFRPVSAQFTLWEVYPDGTYVANPNKGYSSHSRGNTVDITLVRSDGTEIPMPTDLDDFSEKADRDYSDCTEEEAANALYLEELMKSNGFSPYSAEWWHFSDTDSYEAAIGIEISDTAG